MKIILVLAALVVSTSAFMFPAPRDNLNQNATLLCLRNETTCAMEIVIASADGAEFVYFENPMDATDNTYSTENSDGVGIPLISGDGTEAQPWRIRIMADCSSLPTLGSTAHTIAAKGLIVADSLEVSVLVKHRVTASQDQIFYVEDVRYRPVCNFTLAGPQEVIANLSVAGDNDEAISQEVNTAVLGPSTAFFTDGTAFIANLGEDMSWRAAVEGIATSSATGLYLWDCRVCDAAGCGGSVNVVVIDNNGCPIDETRFPRFRQTAEGVSETDNFPAFNVNSQQNPPGYYLRCQVDFCFDITDTRCLDFCNHNTGLRKKRQAAEEETSTTGRRLEGRLNIRISFDGSNQPNVNVNDVSQPAVTEPDNKPVSDSNIGLLAAVITLSALLLVCLIVAVGVFIRLSTRNQRDKAKA